MELVLLVRTRLIRCDASLTQRSESTPVLVTIDCDIRSGIHTSVIHRDSGHK